MTFLALGTSRGCGRKGGCRNPAQCTEVPAGPRNPGSGDLLNHLILIFAYKGGHTGLWGSGTHRAGLASFPQRAGHTHMQSGGAVEGAGPALGRGLGRTRPLGTHGERLLSLLPCPQLQFQEDLEITHMFSAEGEEVQLSFSIYPSSNVEDWLREVERSMKTSVRDIIERAIKAYPTVSRVPHPNIASVTPRSLTGPPAHPPASSSGSQSTRGSLGAGGPWGAGGGI